MYDRDYIQEQLDSKYFRDFAVKEARFIAQKLGLKPGTRLLDAPCGAGRHAREFARMGFQVTALDINPECIRFTRQNCKALGVTAKVGNIQDLSSLKSQFDVVTNLFTSFGYFTTDAENEAVLAQLLSTLKPGGKIAIQLINRDWLLKVFKPVQWRVERGIVDLEARQYEPKSKYIESYRLVVDPNSGKGRSYFWRIRLYSKQEMIKLLRKHGVKKIRVYPAASRIPFTKQINSHPLYVGEV